MSIILHTYNGPTTKPTDFIIVNQPTQSWIYNHLDVVTDGILASCVVSEVPHRDEWSS